MKTTIAKAVSAYRTLNEAKLSKMEASEQIALVKIMRPLRRAFEDYDSFIKESVKKLAPEGWDAMQGVLSELEALKGEELEKRLEAEDARKAVALRREYSDKIVELDNSEAAKEIELDFTPLPEDALGRLFAGNDLTASQCLELSDMLLAQ